MIIIPCPVCQNGAKSRLLLLIIMDLRCVLVTAPWVLGPNHVSTRPRLWPITNSHTLYIRHDRSHYCKFVIGHSLGRMESRLKKFTPQCMHRLIKFTPHCMYRLKKFTPHCMHRLKKFTPHCMYRLKKFTPHCMYRLIKFNALDGKIDRTRAGQWLESCPNTNRMVLNI